MVRKWSIYIRTCVCSWNSRANETKCESLIYRLVWISPLLNVIDNADFPLDWFLTIAKWKETEREREIKWAFKKIMNYLLYWHISFRTNYQCNMHEECCFNAVNIMCMFVLNIQFISRINSVLMYTQTHRKCPMDEHSKCDKMRNIAISNGEC